ncbi:MAG: archease [Candidatus Aenigmarchaeota archaeon]|nr:archease [Candidatus Aenigmarchaeota archaeon]
MRFRFVEDLTSDVVFEAFGKNTNELFENAAFALFNVISQPEKVSSDIEKKVSVEGSDLKDLMFNWLQELIGLVDLENMFFSKFVVDEISETKLKAKCFGEEADPAKGGTLVKAVTYYKFNIEKTDDGYKATVSLDI